MGAGDERRAVLGLWGTPGLGLVALASIREKYPDLSELADERPLRWLSSVALKAPAREGLLGLSGTLGQHADQILDRCDVNRIAVCFPDDFTYPRGLAAISNAPPLLFYQGRGDRPNGPRRLAIVGSRSFEPNFIGAARALAMQLATKLTLVSGAARGIDQLCHSAALDAKGETWAFMGGALDTLDRSQAIIAPKIIDDGGTVFSEFPPGVRAEKATFPRRNRLIAGASDAVLLMRASPDSGALITVEHAIEQGKKVMAVPGQIDHLTAVGPNALIRSAHATCVTCAEHVFTDMGLTVTTTPEPVVLGEPVDLSTLSSNARHAFEVLTRSPVDFDSLLGLARPLSSGMLASALVELELAGLLVQKPGRRYERR